MALAQRDRDALHVRVGFQNFVAKRAVLFAVQLAGFDVHIDGNFERFLHVFFVGNRHIDVLGKLAHDLAGLFAIFPEVLAVIEVAGNGDVPLLRFLDRLKRQLHRAFRNRRRNTRDMEPVHTLEGFVPVDIAGLCQRDRGIRAVIDDLARQLVCAALQVINAHTTLAADDLLCAHAKIAQLADAGVCNIVLRQNSQKFRVHAVICKGDCHVRLAAAEGSFQHRTLEEALVSRRFQAEHNFTECQNFHLRPSLLLQQMHGETAELIFEVCNCHTTVFILC